MQQIFSPKQIKAARALLNWSQTDLASKSGVTQTTILRIEKADKLTSFVTTLQNIIDAFNDAGVFFTKAEDNSEFGVVLKVKKGGGSMKKVSKS